MYVSSSYEMVKRSFEKEPGKKSQCPVSHFQRRCDHILNVVLETDIQVCSRIEWRFIMGHTDTDARTYVRVHLRIPSQYPSRHPLEAVTSQGDCKLQREK